MIGFALSIPHRLCRFALDCSGRRSFELIGHEVPPLGGVLGTSADVWECRPSCLIALLLRPLSAALCFIRHVPDIGTLTVRCIYRCDRAWLTSPQI
jgi:hypothetical protein